LALGFGAALLAAAPFAARHAQAEDAHGWNADAAAHYLDGRAAAWKSHHDTQRSHGTACISCHTGLPYLLARPELRRVLGEGTWPGPERALVADVEKRSRLWSEVEPWYAHTPDKILESRGTESVLNALVLALRDRDRGATSPLTEQALEHMWKEQRKDGSEKGGWRWLEFDLAPWETRESEVWGAGLAALAVRATGGGSTKAEEGAPLALLEGYLRRKAGEPLNLHSRLGILWASTFWKGLLPPEEQARIAATVVQVQRSDGGFSLEQLGSWVRHDASPAHQESDGYATGLATYVLLRHADPTLRPAVDRGLAWLRTHQDPEGSWPASSANLSRDKSSEFVRAFMRDAASGYAVLALCEADRRGP
jgi:hypothetical protein